MRVTKKNVYSFIGRKCTVKFSKNNYIIVGMNRKGRLLVLLDGETDGIINRKPVYFSDVKLIDDEEKR